MTIFFRMLESAASEKPKDLLTCIALLRSRGAASEAGRGMVYEQLVQDLSAVPGSPFAYWVNRRLRSLFTSLSDMTAMGGCSKCGLGTLDDFRFLRLWWERSSSKWVPFPKGGAFSLWYSSVPLTLNWPAEDSPGKELKAFVEARVGSASRKVQAQDFYFRPGLTWPRRTQSGLGVRIMPAGCIFADKGPAVFVRDNTPDDLLALLAILTSSIFRYLVELQMTFGSYEVGVIQRTPIPGLDHTGRQALAGLARRAWSLKRQLDTATETSYAFLLPPELNEQVAGFDRADVERQLRQIQGEIDEAAFSLYRIIARDRAEVEAAFDGSPGDNISLELSDQASGEGVESQNDSRELTTSWLVGVAFGRFDPSLASGERPIPPEPEPFDRLPVRSPGMWPEGAEPSMPPPDVLVDDPGHARDLTAYVANIAATIGVSEPDDPRAWLAHKFFPLHIKMYSESRRKAPIYWQLATPSASYSVWLYIHAFTRDTFFRVQNDYVAPKLEHEQRRLETMLREAGERATAAERRALAAQEAFVGELRDFLDEVKRVAPLWNPDLDDGVIINFAPLWRLVPQHKPWQRELKATWDALCEGKYDWAHLAMRLWPERVVPKCAADRSLAIAHDLEEVFWVQGEDGKWAARPAPAVPVDGLVQQRTSTAVKSALRSLLNAPVTNGRGRRRRSTGNDGGR